MLRGLFLLLFSVLASHAGAKAENKIVGGESAAKDQWPWMTAIVRSEESAARGFYCGASLIAPQWVLTAAHCLVDDNGITGNVDASEFVVSLYQRSKEASETNATRVAADAFFIHPDYNTATTPANHADIALVRLATPLSTTAITPLSEADMSSVTADTIATITGWGLTRENGSSSDILQEAEVPIVDHDQCKANYGDSVDDSMICAGETAGGTDSCQGDSGGPLMVQKNDTWRLAGIVSFGQGCARPNFPGVYTRVASFKPWIDYVMSYAHGLANLPQRLLAAQAQDEAFGTQLVNFGSETLTISSLKLITNTSLKLVLDNNDCIGKTLAPNASCLVKGHFRSSVASGGVLTGIIQSQYTSPSLTGTQLFNMNQASVIVMPPSNLGADVEQPNLDVYSGADAAWSRSTTTVNSGISAIRSGDINGHQHSAFVAYTEGPAKLQFAWKASSELGYDYFTFYLNNLPISRISGDSEWREFSYSLPSGEHKLSWIYQKDGNVDRHDDAAYLDNIRLTSNESNGTDPGRNSSSDGDDSSSSGGGGGGGSALWLLLACGLSRFRKQTTANKTN